MSSAGRLDIVGTGIRPGGHLTAETRHLISGASCALALVDGLTLAAIEMLNPATRSLQDCYALGRQRDHSYAEMVERILAPLVDGHQVCAVFYGHPGVFVWPAHEAIRQARAAGYPARMYPGISAEDCLFADLGLDPAVHGCQSFEATDFLLYARRFDPTAALILWQPAALGDLSRASFETDPDWVRALAEVLMNDYPADHPVVIYEAATFPLAEPRIEPIALAQLHQATFRQISTLYLAPVGPPELNPVRLQRLGIDPGDLAEAAFRHYRQRLKPGRS
jgi:precorrin-6B methylase 1